MKSGPARRTITWCAPLLLLGLATAGVIPAAVRARAPEVPGAEEIACVLAALGQALEAQRAWQQGVCELSAARLTADQALLVRTSHDLQLAYLERQEIRVRHLAATAPQRLRSVPAALALGADWTDSDELALGARDPGYGRFAVRLDSLSALVEGQPAWEDIRLVMLDLARNDADYASLAGGLALAIRQADAALAECAEEPGR